jgi:carboxylesterase
VLDVRVDHGREIDLPGGPDAALLLHGLTGSTFELHTLAERLHAAGLRVLAPVMAGHGGAPEALRGLSSAAWVAQAERDLDRLRGARRTFVAGVSMGALVASALVQRHPDRVHGLLLFAPALRVSGAVRLAALLGWIPWVRHLILPKGAPDLRDEEMCRRRAGTLSGVPSSALLELLRLARRVDRGLPGIEAPALVVAGARDRTATLRGVHRLVRHLGGGAELLVLEESAHHVLIDVERDRAVETAARFVERLRGGWAAPTRPLTDAEHRRRR